jgi:hypothetical protein
MVIYLGSSVELLQSTQSGFDVGVDQVKCPGFSHKDIDSVSSVRRDRVDRAHKGRGYR